MMKSSQNLGTTYFNEFRVVQDELDELLNKERQNFGLEEILKRKKEKL